MQGPSCVQSRATRLHRPGARLGRGKAVCIKAAVAVRRVQGTWGDPGHEGARAGVVALWLPDQAAGEGATQAGAAEGLGHFFSPRREAGRADIVIPIIPYCLVAQD